ncbi:putative pseudouridine synthase [Ordospora colligata]|nr:putative pseudouridine synthase [Ordospora colligata]
MTADDAEYFFTYRTNAKERWYNKSLLDVLEHEFRTRSREYFSQALECGVITVNGNMIDTSTIIKPNDVLQHTVHIHEPPIPCINVIKKEKDYMVVNKPAGIPCHPTGGYREYSITRALFGDSKVACVNRLDMPVSGVLIIAFENHTKCLDAIKAAEKVYLAKVCGMFPDKVTVDKKIECLSGRYRRVGDNGKECLTMFKRLRYSDGYSIVECRPVTGRTHQIRIHLQSIGFPIVNDVIYGSGELPISLHSSECNANIDQFEDKKKYECIIKNCKGKNNRSFITRDHHICLHAWKYIYNNTEYVAEIPEWCDL